MKTKHALLILTIGLIAILGTFAAHGSDITVQERQERLEILVDEYIACCDAKAALRQSRSEKIRNSADRASIKAVYYKQHREDLVREMLENDIEPKAYRVRRFLNEKFGGNRNESVYSRK